MINIALKIKCQILYHAWSDHLTKKQGFMSTSNLNNIDYITVFIWNVLYLYGCM